MSSPDTIDRPKPKRTLPAACAAAAVKFLPGWPGRKRCTSTKRDGTPCGMLAAHGQDTCTVHHRQMRARLLTVRRARCPVLRVKRPPCQCAKPVTSGSVCGHHARQAARGVPLVLVPAGQRVAHMPPRPPKPKRASPVLAHAAPRELRALPAWRACTGQRERAALVQAYMARDTHPEAWRAMVRALHERGGGA